MFVYVGGYTTPDSAGQPRGDGILVFELASPAGKLRHIATVTGIENPSFLAFGPGERTLYAVRETSKELHGLPGAIFAFTRDASTGRLSPLNEQPSYGADPCHIGVDPAGRFLLLANYSSGSVAAIPLGPNGELGNAGQVLQHEGTGSPHPRQQGPHAHATVLDPTRRFALAVDLGLDRVFVYRIEDSTGMLRAHDPPYTVVAAEAGPRHLAFAPDGESAYLVNELDSTLSACTWDSNAGALRVVQTVSTLPDGFHGVNFAAAVRVEPSGRFVYVSNRGHDSIALFEREAGAITVTPRGHTSCGGRTPRDFAIVTGGELLLVANQESHSVAAFTIDRQSGALSPTGVVTPTPTPTCIVVSTA